MKFAEKYNLPFVLLSDPNRDAIEKFGVWQEKKLYGKASMGVVRTTFIINEEGIIEKIMPNVKPDCPVFLPKLDMGKWMSVAAVVKVSGKDYTVTLYANGKKPVTKTFKNLNYKATDAEITFGRGWGSTWHFDGAVALFKVFDTPLSEKEIKALDAKSPVKL